MEVIYEFEKYNNVDDFICNRPRPRSNQQYTVLNKCKGFDNNIRSFTEHCFGCLFCVANNEVLLNEMLRKRGTDYISRNAELSFNGCPVPAPHTISGLQHPYNDLEEFTGKEERSDIQPWAAGLFDVLSSCEKRVSMEIPICNNDYPRNGRLDIGVIVDDLFLAVESKTSLDDALKDERFVDQHTKYTVEIERYTKKYIYLTLLGGKETDMFPPDNKYCTGKIGNKTNRFYELICNKQIRFITANAFWCLCCNYLKYGKDYCWDKFLRTVFSDTECIGLLSAGKVVKSNNGYSIEPLKRSSDS